MTAPTPPSPPIYVPKGEAMAPPGAPMRSNNPPFTISAEGSVLKVQTDVTHPDAEFGVFRRKKVHVCIAGVNVSGSHALVKNCLLNYGTEAAIRDAAKLRSPIVKVDLGNQKLKGDVNTVERRLHEVISSRTISSDYFDGKITMPEEAVSMCHQLPPHSQCPRCKASLCAGDIEKPGTPMLRGLVQRSKRPWYAPWRKRPYCAVICHCCKEIIGWEAPHTDHSKGTGPYR